MNFSLRLPLLLLFIGLVLPACIHLHPDFMAQAADGDSGFRDHDFDDADDDDDDQDGLEQHIRHLEETLQRIEQEMREIHQALDEAHREMDRRHEGDDEEHEDDRHGDDRHDNDRRDDDRHDDDRRDDGRDRNFHLRDGEQDKERRRIETHIQQVNARGQSYTDSHEGMQRDSLFNQRRMPDRERPKVLRMVRFESNGEPPMEGHIFGRTDEDGPMPGGFGRTGVRAFQVGMPGNRGPEGRRIGQRDQRTRDGGGLGAENRDRRNDRGRARGRQMRPQQRPGGDPRAREGRGNEQDRNRGNNDQDQQQIHWSGSLEQMPDHILEMLKNLDVDIPFGRAGDGESHVEIEVIRSEHSDRPEGDKNIKGRFVVVDTGKTFEFNLGNAVRGVPLISGESIEWIGDHSMPGEVHIIRIGSDLPPGNKKAINKKASNKKASNKKASNKKAINKKAINKKKAAARKNAAMKKKAGNKKTGKKKTDKQEADKKKTDRKKSDKKKTDKKKADKKEVVEIESKAIFKFVVGGTDGEESNVIFGSTEGIDQDQQSIHWSGSLEEMPDHIREMFESLDMVDVEELLGDLDEIPDEVKILLEGHDLPKDQLEDSSKKKVEVEKKTDKKKTDEKKSDKKKDNKETDKKKDDVTLEGRIVL